MQKVMSFFILALSLSCCDCVLEGSGVILDAETNLPVDSVRIRRVSKLKTQMEFYSGEDGGFSAHYISGGLGRCPDLNLEISKEGYRNQRITNPQSDTIYLSKMH